MNITELDNYRLSDAVKFHDRLNPRLWDQSEHLRPEVKNKLLEIAADFQQFLGVPDLDVKDITVSGSNAAYNYTPSSDIDLHLVVDLPEADRSEVFRELFDAKKYQYNDMHNIKIGGFDVELYVQDPRQEHHSQGIYSLVNDNWVSVPKRRKPEIDDVSVRSKAEDLAARIDDAVKSNNYQHIAELHKKIKTMRQSGLEQQGEYGSDNLAFKVLRNQGYIKKLIDARNAARDAELSLQERKKKKKKVRYGFGGYWAPGFSFGSEAEGGGDGGGGESMREDDTGMAQGSAIGDAGAQSTWDGVSPDTQEFLSEQQDHTELVNEFIQDTARKLGIKSLPKIYLHNDAAWSQENGSFGKYVPDTHELHVSLTNRHLLDILRTTAHELAHCAQNQIQSLPNDAGETGSPWENEAHAVAGMIMRDYADSHPELFMRQEIEEGVMSRAGAAAALAAALAMTPAQAQDYLPPEQQPQAQQLNPAQVLNVARTLYRLKHNVTRAGAEEELNQEFKNYLRAQQGDPGAQNQSRVWQMQQRRQQAQQPQQPWTGNQYQREDIAEASGYIPTDAEKNDPRFVMALSPDVRPGATGKNANKMALRTDAQGRPQQARTNGLVESIAREFEQFDESTALFEIKMTGKNLRAEAAKTGAQAGMEFEMIVPNTEVDVEPEYEPDWDQDQRARSFSDVRDFFYDGDYNSRRDADNLIEELTGEYEEWKQEQTAEQWERDGVDYIRDFVEVNDLFDRDEALDQAQDEVIAANPELPTESEDFQQLVNARLDELQEQFVLEAFEDRGRIHDDAFETFAQEQNEEYDERSFLDDKYQTMSDIQSNFDIAWPYYYDINDGQDGDMDIDQVADEFSSYMGKPVNASKSYHGARREAGHYVVEPDGSLEGDNPGDGGLEFVSPPMPIDEMISDLNKVKEWAGRTGCYTNDSTGLHINISVPDYSIDKLDYVKLAILMGDEYILDLFGRSGNTYAKSAMGKIKSALKQKPEAAAQIMDLMKQGLDGAATKAIHTGITDKYTSINTKTGYIEFRSPGGDWLDSNFANIENTLLRFTVALSAAINPEAYRKEYLTKLYKLLSEGMADKSDVNIIQLFSNYSAGELDKPALIRQVRQKQLARNVAKGKATGKMWWNVSNPANSFASIEVVASSKEEAIDIAVQPGNYPDWARTKNTLRATPIRPYQEEPKGPTLNNRPSNPDGNYVIVSQEDESVPVYRFMASGDQDAISVLRQWISANPGMYRWTFKKDAEQALGQPGAPAQPAADNQGNWGIWIRANDRFANQPGSYSRNETPPLMRFPSREAAEQWIEQQRATRPNMRTDIEVREIEPAAQPVNRNTLAPTGPGPWEVFRISDGSSVAELGQTNRMSAEVEARRVIDQRGEAPELYGVRTRQSDSAQAGQFQEPDVRRGDLTPRGPGPWEIYRLSDNSSVRVLSHTDRPSAEVEARMALGMRGEAPELYAVRTRQVSGSAPRSSYELFLKSNGRVVTAPSGNPIVFQATDPDDAANKIARYVADFNLPGDPTNYDVRLVLQPAQQDAAQGGIVDVAGEQPAAPQAPQEWTGAWLVLDPEGRVLQRFTGIGNVQADANRHAMNWLRSNPRHMQAGVTVAPEMA